MLAKSRRLSSERCLSLLNLLVTHSAWSHLSLACVWPGNLTSKHISACVFVRCCCLPLDQLSSKTDTGFQHEANWSNVFFLISAEELMAELSKPSNNSAQLKPPLWSLPRALEKKEICTAVPLCTYLIIPINVPRVCSTGSQDFWRPELVHRWQVPL